YKPDNLKWGKFLDEENQSIISDAIVLWEQNITDPTPEMDIEFIQKIQQYLARELNLKPLHRTIASDKPDLLKILKLGEIKSLITGIYLELPADGTNDLSNDLALTEKIRQKLRELLAASDWKDLLNDQSMLADKDQAGIKGPQFSKVPEREANERENERRASIEIRQQLGIMYGELEQIIIRRRGANTAEKLQSIELQEQNLISQLRSLYADMFLDIPSGRSYNFYSDYLKELKGNRRKLSRMIELADAEKNKKELERLNRKAIRNNRLLLKIQILIAGKLLTGKSRDGRRHILPALNAIEGAINSANALEIELEYRIQRLRGQKLRKSFETNDWFGNRLRTYRLGTFGIQVEKKEGQAEPTVIIRQKRPINVHTKLDQIRLQANRGEIKQAVVKIDELIRLYSLHYLVTKESYKKINDDLKELRRVINDLTPGQKLKNGTIKDELKTRIDNLIKNIRFPKQMIWTNVPYKGIRQAFDGHVQKIASELDQYMVVLKYKTDLTYYAKILHQASQRKEQKRKITLSLHNRAMMIKKLKELREWTGRGFVTPKIFATIDLEPVITLIDADDFKRAEDHLQKVITRLNGRLKDIDRIAINLKISAASLFVKFRDDDIITRTQIIAKTLKDAEFTSALRLLSDLNQEYFNQAHVEPGLIRAAHRLQKTENELKKYETPNTNTIETLIKTVEALKDDIRHKSKFGIVLNSETIKGKVYYIEPGTTIQGLLNIMGQKDTAFTDIIVNGSRVNRDNLSRTKLRDETHIILKQTSPEQDTAMLSNYNAYLAKTLHVDESSIARALGKAFDPGEFFVLWQEFVETKEIDPDLDKLLRNIFTGAFKEALTYKDGEPHFSSSKMTSFFSKHLNEFRSHLKLSTKYSVRIDFYDSFESLNLDYPTEFHRTIIYLMWHSVDWETFVDKIEETNGTIELELKNRILNKEFPMVYETFQPPLPELYNQEDYFSFHRFVHWYKEDKKNNKKYLLPGSKLSIVDKFTDEKYEVIFDHFYYAKDDDEIAAGIYTADGKYIDQESIERIFFISIPPNDQAMVGDYTQFLADLLHIHPDIIADALGQSLDKNKFIDLWKKLAVIKNIPREMDEEMQSDLRKILDQYGKPFDAFELLENFIFEAIQFQEYLPDPDDDISADILLYDEMESLELSYPDGFIRALIYILGNSINWKKFIELVENVRFDPEIKKLIINKNINIEFDLFDDDLDDENQSAQISYSFNEFINSYRTGKNHKIVLPQGTRLIIQDIFNEEYDVLFDHFDNPESPSGLFTMEGNFFDESFIRTIDTIDVAMMGDFSHNLSQLLKVKPPLIAYALGESLDKTYLKKYWDEISKLNKINPELDQRIQKILFDAVEKYGRPFDGQKLFSYFTDPSLQLSQELPESLPPGTLEVNLNAPYKSMKLDYPNGYLVTLNYILGNSIDWGKFVEIIEKKDWDDLKGITERESKRKIPKDLKDKIYNREISYNFRLKYAPPKYWLTQSGFKPFSDFVDDYRSNNNLEMTLPRGTQLTIRTQVGKRFEEFSVLFDKFDNDSEPKGIYAIRGSYFRSEIIIGIRVHDGFPYENIFSDKSMLGDNINFIADLLNVEPADLLTAFEETLKEGDLLVNWNLFVKENNIEADLNEQVIKMLGEARAQFGQHRSLPKLIDYFIKQSLQFSQLLPEDPNTQPVEFQLNAPIEKMTLSYPNGLFGILIYLIGKSIDWNNFVTKIAAKLDHPLERSDLKKLVSNGMLPVSIDMSTAISKHPAEQKTFNDFGEFIKFAQNSKNALPWGTWIEIETSIPLKEDFEFKDSLVRFDKIIYDKNTNAPLAIHTIDGEYIHKGIITNIILPKSIVYDEAIKDKAMSGQKKDLGGIDFNTENMLLEESGSDFHFRSSVPSSLPNINGIKPVIINITPLPSLFPLLGITDEIKHEHTAQISLPDAAQRL
ncbi:MAG: hypothetical protein KBD53_11225, partial [Candidatus Omnitrophica bacterium]|nr:hypothetical protein [Candidatus Omnitrophota bacterium]